MLLEKPRDAVRLIKLYLDHELATKHLELAARTMQDSHEQARRRHEPEPHTRPIFRNSVDNARQWFGERQPVGGGRSLRTSVWAGVAKLSCSKMYRWREVRRVAYTTRPTGERQTMSP